MTDPKQTAADLRAARALIEKPECWTQAVYARDQFGDSVDYGSDDACRFCAIGSIRRVIIDEIGYYSHSRLDAAHKAFKSLTLGTLIDFNDSHTHSEVLALFDRAIAACEAQA